MRRSAKPSHLLAIAVCCVLEVAWAADAPAVHVRNFGKVNDHIYRGGEPTAVGLEELGAMGVKVDIDLRQAGEGTDVEKKAAEKLGMKYINIPFPPLSAPSNALVERVLLLLTGSDKDTIFVHCRRGKDRTGTVVACYRIQHDGWDNQRALLEAKQYGMSFAERGMRSYIIRFSPLPPAAALVPTR
jgi:tyrosine-protein phosphatase SIW14